MLDDLDVNPTTLRIALAAAALLLMAAGTAIAGPGDTICLHTPLEYGCL